MTLPVLSFGDYRVKRNEPLDREFFDRRFRLIIEAYTQLRTETERQGATSDQLIALGLTRINEVLTPLLTRLTQASELGFLIGVSETPLTLTVGFEPTFEINEETRQLFKPTPYLTISRATEGAEDQFAMAKLIEYNVDNGGLSVEILTIENISGEHNDWVISASAGLPLSVMSQAEAIATLAAQVAADREAVEEALEAVSGSVLSVAGRTGDVVLVMNDISGLVTALGGKASSSHTHVASDIASGTINIARIGTGTRDGTRVLRDDGQWVSIGDGSVSWGDLSGDITDQTDLQDALDDKSDVGHTHSIANITGLQTTLDGKTAVGHNHSISDVTGLSSALSGKQDYDADLDAIAALVGATGFLKKTGAGTWALDTSTYLTSLGVGSLTQAWDADLDAIAALAGTSGFLKKTAANTWALDTSVISFPSGTAMLFVQTAAPTGWTKDTTHNNKALRLVSGTAGSGGSVAFTTAFASQTPSGTVGSTTLTSAQIPSHTHTFEVTQATNTTVGGSATRAANAANVGAGQSSGVTSTAGSGGSHTHSFTGTAINLAVAYVDAIIATKD